jgi:hypothetical protein
MEAEIIKARNLGQQRLKKMCFGMRVYIDNLAKSNPIGKYLAEIKEMSEEDRETLKKLYTDAISSWTKIYSIKKTINEEDKKAIDEQSEKTKEEIEQRKRILELVEKTSSEMEKYSATLSKAVTRDVENTDFAMKNKFAPVARIQAPQLQSLSRQNVSDDTVRIVKEQQLQRAIEVTTNLYGEQALVVKRLKVLYDNMKTPQTKSPAEMLSKQNPDTMRSVDNPYLSQKDLSAYDARIAKEQQLQRAIEVTTELYGANSEQAKQLQTVYNKIFDADGAKAYENALGTVSDAFDMIANSAQAIKDNPAIKALATSIMILNAVQAFQPPSAYFQH